jgi:hypothetical protein
MASNFSPLEIRRRLGRGDWSTPTPFGPDGWKYVHLNGTASVIVSCAPHGEHEWIHASIARTHEMPSYGDLKALHWAVFGDGWAYQVFAPRSDHVNIHEHALHLFGRLDGKPELPDFTDGTGSI